MLFLCNRLENCCGAGGACFGVHCSVVSTYTVQYCGEVGFDCVYRDGIVWLCSTGAVYCSGIGLCVYVCAVQVLRCLCVRELLI